MKPQEACLSADRFYSARSAAFIRPATAGRRGRRSGFTLIELLVVIAVIMILIRVLLPVVAVAKERALTAKCASNMRQLGVAFGAYLSEWGVYPGGGTIPVGGTNIGGSNWVGLDSNSHPVSCWPRSSALGVYANPGKAPTTNAELCRNTIYWCPADGHLDATRVDGTRFYISYQMSGGRGTDDRWKFVLPNNVVNPAGKYLLLEDDEDLTNASNNDAMFRCAAAGPGGPTGLGDHVTARHSGGANALYADGHVKWSKRGKEPGAACTSATPGTFEYDVSCGDYSRGCIFYFDNFDATTY